MQTLAFDGRTGASGDMILAALIAAGADPDALTPVEDVLPIEYRIGETTKNGIAATTVDVLIEDGQEESGVHGHEDGHPHDHDHDHSHEHAEGASANRTYVECHDLVEGMSLFGSVEADALAIFELLGTAEARVHGTDLESTHFHEVGADDAIADIVGAALLVEDLGVDRIVTTPVSAGGGTVSMSHGVYPVPAPAVANIAVEADWELQGGPIDIELLTPTGAAILAHFAEGVESLPALSIETVGYGAGTKSFPDRPNVLRATVGAARGGLVRDDIRVLETNVDDATPEAIGGLFDRLSEAGARDVSVVPTTMKKSRPGHLIRVIVKPEQVQSVARTLASETGTLGIRETAASHRWIAERAFETVTIEIEGEAHDVTVKIASDDSGTVYDVSTEYDDAVAIAHETGLPVREVIRRAESEYDDRI